MGLIPISDGIEQINDTVIDVVIDIENSIKYLNELCTISEKEELKDSCIAYLRDISVEVERINNYLNKTIKGEGR